MSNPLRRRGAAAALSVLLVLAACGDDDGGDTLSGNVIKDGLGCSITTAERSAETPEVDLSNVETGPTDADADADADDANGEEADGDQEGDEEAGGDEASDPAEDPEADTLSEPEVEDLVVVDDEAACDVSKRSYITLDMVGVKASDGVEFVNTFGQERPVNVQAGHGQLLIGLENGLADMRVGGRRQITVPPGLAYGADGNPDQGIGPDETLVFVVDVVAVTDQPDHCNEVRPIPAGREGKPTAVDMPLEPWTELTTNDIEVGEGDPVGRDAYVRMEYLGVGCFSGAQFDSSWDRDEPFPVALDEAEPISGFSSVIQGWTDGIEGMKLGGVRQINIPAELAYGKRGSPPDIGSNEPLIFVVELVEIVSAEDAQAEAQAELEASGDIVSPDISVDDGDADGSAPADDPVDGADDSAGDGG